MERRARLPALFGSCNDQHAKRAKRRDTLSLLQRETDIRKKRKIVLWKFRVCKNIRSTIEETTKLTGPSPPDHIHPGAYLNHSVD